MVCDEFATHKNLYDIRMTVLRLNLHNSRE